jgi:hypothetical protein
MIRRAAILGFDDSCRFVLERGPSDGRTAAWLMCNPSTADASLDDQTNRRVVHHSARAGCPRSLIGNVWPLRTAFPSELFKWLGDGTYTEAMQAANLDALAMISAQADVHVVAFGALRSYARCVDKALDAFSQGGRVPLYCLGTTGDGLPLHPLARGKHAVRNDATLREWRP